MKGEEDILEMAEQYPDRLIPFCNIDPRILTNSADAPLDIVLRYYRNQGCKGVGEVMPNMPLIDPMVDLLLDWRDRNIISESAFDKVARENAVKLLGLE